MYAACVELTRGQQHLLLIQIVDASSSLDFNPGPRGPVAVLSIFAAFHVYYLG